MTGTLKAPLHVEFDYTRSLGPVLSSFMTGLRDHTVLGGRCFDGRVIVPPPEYDPTTHEPLVDLVPVSTTGTVETWSWVSEPVPGQPFDRPFAFALVRLDGADTPMLHAVDVAGPEQMDTGMRVRVRWAEDTVGHIRDIVCFEPTGPGADEASAGTPATVAAPPDGVRGIVTPVSLDYTYAASAEESRFLRGMAEGKIRGQRCPRCEKVYVPPRGACPVDGVPTRDEVELPDRGIVTTFCIVNVPFLGQRIAPPYVSAYVLLEGADIPFLHLVLGCDASDVRMGMRVEAVWKSREEWTTSMQNIDHFRPTGEPDAAYESFAAHL
ncbi:MAG TPA: OB-fold domain-containing protein [Nocardioidaceae bacterium]|nr:OB-fold domain-containing protein [Nocardioidaceae bacterium]